MDPKVDLQAVRGSEEFPASLFYGDESTCQAGTASCPRVILGTARGSAIQENAVLITTPARTLSKFKAFIILGCKT